MAKRLKVNGEKLPDPAIKRCLDAFYEGYTRRHNPPAIADEILAAYAGRRMADLPKAGKVILKVDYKKDSTLIRRMLATWDEPTVLRLIDDFFGRAYLDYRVINSNQDVGALYMVAPKLLLRDRIPPDRRTAEIHDAALRAQQPTKRSDE